METIDASRAAIHLAALLDRVANGERITITRHGLPAAVLVPFAEAKARLSHQDIVEEMCVLRKRVKPDKMTVREMINDGRRF